MNEISHERFYWLNGNSDGELFTKNFVNNWVDKNQVALKSYW